MPPIATQKLQPVLSVFWREESLSVRGESFSGRLYVPAEVPENAGLVLHLHGGHFNSGSPAEGQAVAAALTEAGAVVFSLSYPLAPAHRFPETLELIYGALEALASGRSRWATRGAPIYVAGEEAGGNLAAALAMMTRDRGGPALAGQILLSPMLDACLGTASLRGAQAGPVGCCWADGWADYLGTPERAAHPYAAPLQATRLAGLPPALLISAQDDPMRDEAAQYAARLARAGVAVRHVELAAPTRWPQAYADVPEKGSCLCKTCGEIAAFYERTAPS
ncbi:alpha/beta hydrolase fold domain-containing protein [Pseudochelatococcus sp. B33]